MDLAFLSQADAAALELEKARRLTEAAQNRLDGAKNQYQELLDQAEAHGFSKSKLKKLNEDRIANLVENGLVDFGSNETTTPKIAKAERTRNAKGKKSLPDDREAHTHLPTDDDLLEMKAYNSNALEHFRSTEVEEPRREEVYS